MSNINHIANATPPGIFHRDPEASEAAGHDVYTSGQRGLTDDGIGTLEALWDTDDGISVYPDAPYCMTAGEFIRWARAVSKFADELEAAGGDAL